MESDSTAQIDMELATSSFDNSILRRLTNRPRLLVSVRSRYEADQALAGGADILDVKEPSLGSLGMANADEIRAIAAAALISDGMVPLSVALGEVCDWNPGAIIPGLPQGVAYAKLGLSHCQQCANWQADWTRVRAEFQARCTSPIRWVAVAYADSSQAASPDLDDVLAAAIETDCAGMLVDTWTKDGRTLFDEVDPAMLIEMAHHCHAAGLFFTLAGRLNRESLASLSKIPADVIAIRSAACCDSDRTSKLDQTRVAEFRQALGRSM